MKLTPQPINLDELPVLELEKEQYTISGNRNLYHYKLKSKDKSRTQVNSNPHQDDTEKKK